MTARAALLAMPTVRSALIPSQKEPHAHWVTHLTPSFPWSVSGHAGPSLKMKTQRSLVVEAIIRTPAWP